MVAYIRLNLFWVTPAATRKRSAALLEKEASQEGENQRAISCKSQVDDELEESEEEGLAPTRTQTIRASKRQRKNTRHISSDDETEDDDMALYSVKDILNFNMQVDGEDEDVNTDADAASVQNEEHDGHPISLGNPSSDEVMEGDEIDGDIDGDIDVSAEKGGRSRGLDDDDKVSILLVHYPL